jgi:general secretion pathway protein C
LLETFLQKGAEPLKWLLVVGIAYTLAMTIWVFFATPIVATTSTPSETLQSQATTRPAASVNWILNKNLFGRAGEVASIQSSNEVAVQTRLPLELQSVFVSNDAERSSAIVAQKGKPGLVYRLGEKVPGNAELVAIDHDQIILRRAGVRESLSFPHSKTNKVSAIPSANEKSTASNPAISNRPTPRVQKKASKQTSPADSVSGYREKFTEDAKGALQELGIEVADSGGYRIGDINKTPALRQTGLQSGDVILSINGRNVGDLKQDQLELDNILAQGSARIEIRRGERRFFITATLPGEL